MPKILETPAVTVADANKQLRAAISGELELKNKWVVTANAFLGAYGADNSNHFLLAETTTANKFLKDNHSSDAIKGFRETLKKIRKEVKEICEELKHSNDRVVAKRLFDYMRIESGLAQYKHLTKDATPTDKFLGFVKSAHKIVTDTEISNESQEAWFNLESSLMADGLLVEKDNALVNAK